MMHDLNDLNPLMKEIEECGLKNEHYKKIAN
jgi:hypothetical protein